MNVITKIKHLSSQCVGLVVNNLLSLSLSTVCLSFTLMNSCTKHLLRYKSCFNICLLLSTVTCIFNWHRWSIDSVCKCNLLTWLNISAFFVPETQAARIKIRHSNNNNNNNDLARAKSANAWSRYHKRLLRMQDACTSDALADSLICARGSRTREISSPYGTLEAHTIPSISVSDFSPLRYVKS